MADYAMMLVNRFTVIIQKGFFTLAVAFLMMDQALHETWLIILNDTIFTHRSCDVFLDLCDDCCYDHLVKKRIALKEAARCCNSG